MPCTAVKVSGQSPKVSAAGFVAPSSNLVGAVTIGDGASAWYASVIRGDGKAPASIGAGSVVQERACVIGSRVGDRSLIGAGARLTGCTIGNDASIGMGAVVCAGASIGDGAVLTAGSLLPAGKSVPAGEVWGGSPAAKIGLATDVDKEGIQANIDLAGALGKAHMESAWMDLDALEEQAADYKREKERTPTVISQMRYDPKWTPLPTLGKLLEESGAFDLKYAPK
mmetsp:Transcript_29112/g.79479  ORF Transcript_29112/g.79479 Transcript_29112/m.79479 type:complete len:226 (+) Transcript_29112:301-978(+)